MKRILALALVAGALLLGGCGRPDPAPAPGVPAPATTTTAPAARAAATTHPNSAGSATSSSSSTDVGSLLGDVDKQLNSDDQTPADQD